MAVYLVVVVREAEDSHGLDRHASSDQTSLQGLRLKLTLTDIIQVELFQIMTHKKACCLPILT
jgi:hypothetical protein